MDKASYLSLLSNAILYWNTIKINEIVSQPRDADGIDTTRGIVFIWGCCRRAIDADIRVK